MFTVPFHVFLSLPTGSFGETEIRQPDLCCKSLTKSGNNEEKRGETHNGGEKRVTKERHASVFSWPPLLISDPR